MPGPLLAAAAVVIAKGPAYYKKGKELLDDYNRLPAGQKALLEGQAAAVMAALADFKKVSVGGLGLGGRDDLGPVERAMNPDQHFVLASWIVEYLKATGTAHREDLQAAAGGVGHPAADVASAVTIAQQDLMVEQSGADLRLTAMARGDLRGSGDATSAATAIIATVTEKGAATRLELSQAAGAVREQEPAFLSGLGHCLKTGKVAWAGPFLFSLPLDELDAFVRSTNFESGQPEAVTARLAVTNLSVAVAQMTKSLAAVKAGRALAGDGAAVQSGTPAQIAGVAAAELPGAGSASEGRDGDAADVPAQIAELSKLHEAGVLTDEEFASAKASLLGRL